MKFQETLSFKLVQMSTTFKVEIENELKELDLHYGQIFILFELWENDGLSQIDLAARLKVSAPTINRMVRSLQKNGFVIPSPGIDDRRFVNIYLTPKGAAVRPQIEEKWVKLEDKLQSNLTQTEQIILTQLFGKLIENLTEFNS